MKNLFAYITFILLVFASQTAASQPETAEFGKVDASDLLLQECPFDKGAVAMNLVKIEKITFDTAPFNGPVETITEFWLRIKVFDEKGIKNTEVIIPYLVKKDPVEITDIEAYSYNLDENRKVVRQKVEKKQIFNEKSKNDNSYNSVRFIFPAVKKGSVVEYRYKRIDNNAVHVEPFLFADALPSRYSKCTVIVPGFLNLGYHIAAASAVEKDSSAKIYANSIYNEYKMGFAMHNIHALKAEPFMTSIKDNLPRVEITDGRGQSANDPGTQWAIIGEGLLYSPGFGRQFDKPVDDGTGSFIDSVIDLKHIADKIKAVYSHIKKQFSWNGVQTFYPADIAECLKNKSGSSAQLNALLINILRRVGIRCNPILFSTRLNGTVDESYPSPTQLNGFDVMVFDSTNTYILDGSQKNLSLGCTPPDLLSRRAFFLTSQRSKWISIQDSGIAMKTSVVANMAVDTAGLLKGSGQVVYTGLAKAIAANADEKREKEGEHANTMTDNNGEDLKFDTVTRQHQYDDNDTLIHNIIFHGTVASTGDIYFINPFMFSLFRKNPFKDSVRYSDIDLGVSQQYETNIYLMVPTNFSIEETPKNAFISMADSSIVFERTISSSNNLLHIVNNFTIKRTFFSKNEYNVLRSFFNQVYGVISGEILLKKKE